MYAVYMIIYITLQVYTEKETHCINYKNPSNCIVIDNVVYMSIVQKCFSSLLLN